MRFKQILETTTLLLLVVFVSLLGVDAVNADEGSGITTTSKTENIAGVLEVGDIIKSIPAPGLGKPRGLTWDGTYLWMAEDASKMIYKIDPSDGTVIYSFLTPGESFTEGLAWDGTYIWHAEYNGNVYKMNPSDGSLIETILAPTSYPTGLTWDGTYIWTASYNDLLIYQFSSSDGSLINSFSSPGNKPWGMAWDGSYLWHSEYDQGNIYQLNPSDGTVITSLSSPPGSWLLGLTWDGTYLWAVDKNANMIYQIDVGTSPSWSQVYDTVLAEPHADSLNIFRKFRDDVLSKNALGKKYVKQLYENSSEIALLLLTNQNLKSETSSLLEWLLPKIQFLTETGQIVLYKQELKEIDALLGDFAKEASPKLRRLVRKVEKGLKQEKILKQFGIIVSH